jgi:hypothetical protein
VENHDGDGAFTLSAALVNDLGTFPADLWIDAYADTEQPA